ncbi:hypothetical protein J4463_04765 [Candidatus Pacearchaeota archaeon]|nr:hypothetical protein [Candidatus Pacearchaeota archaeon]
MARESYIVHNELTGENYLDDNSKGRNRRFYSHIDELLDALPNSLIGFKPTRLIEFHLSGYTPEQSRAIGLVLKAKMNKAEIIIDSTAKN